MEYHDISLRHDFVLGFLGCLLNSYYWYWKSQLKSNRKEAILNLRCVFHLNSIWKMLKTHLMWRVHIIITFFSESVPLLCPENMFRRSSPNRRNENCGNRWKPFSGLSHFGEDLQSKHSKHVYTWVGRVIAFLALNTTTALATSPLRLPQSIVRYVKDSLK